MSHRIVVASYTNEIFALSFDPATSTLALVSAIAVGHQPSWIAPFTGDNCTICTCLEQANGKVVVLTYDAGGRGRVIAEAPSIGDDPCSILATASELFVANYTSGTAAVWAISSKPPYLSKKDAKVLTFRGSGPNRERQKSPHPHQVVFHELYRELIIPDLGSDRVWRYQKAPNGDYKLHGEVRYKPGSGPRHVAFHDGYIFTVNELANEVTRHTFPPLPAVPTLVASAPTMYRPASDVLAAEIAIPPTSGRYPIPYLYLSNRNVPSARGDVISIFAIADSNGLVLVAEVYTGLKHLRAMVFGGADNRFLIAGGAEGGGVKMYERIEGGRALREVAALPEIQAPTGFLWM